MGGTLSPAMVARKPPRAERLPRSERSLAVARAAELVDHAAFAWNDMGWRPPTLASSVIYELHLGTFTPEGTLDGAIGRLDYLRELGITHVELMPLAAAEGDRGWGYDGVAFLKAALGRVKGTATAASLRDAMEHTTFVGVSGTFRVSPAQPWRLSEDAVLMAQESMAEIEGPEDVALAYLCAIGLIALMAVWAVTGQRSAERAG